MKILLLLIIFSFSPSLIFPQQLYYTFSELKGMEDNSGNTHLFYRLYYHDKTEYSQTTSNDIYHLDLSTKIDTIFLYAGSHWNPIYSSSSGIADVAYWNNNPEEFIYSYISCGIDCSGSIVRFDGNQTDMGSGGYQLPDNIEISNQNDSLLFLSTHNESFKSIDGGISWEIFSDSLSLYSLSPFNDQTIFAQDFNGLYKSTDGGNNFSLVDTFYTNDNANPLNYDKDQIHIYTIINFKGECFLSVSNNKGNAYSWTKKYNSKNKIFISIDNSQSGSIYLADRNYIYYSNDYGENFSLFKKLERKIVGIYKKPNSNKLYAATKYDLYEITPDSIKTIKHLQIDPDIFNWFPLHLGDKWIYHENIDQADPFMTDTEGDWTKEIIGKVIKDNGKEYFEYSYTNYFPYYSYAENLERVDSSSGKVYRYTSDTLNYPEKEYVVIDLFSEIGDTVNSYYYYYSKALLNFDGSLTKWNIPSSYKHFHEFESLAGYNYDVVSNFGLDSIGYGFDFGYSTSYLKGAVINGIVYGDTTITGIEELENIPTSFSLSQNYPNPFNPTTKIKYSIPNVETRHASSVQVTLKVYDILGREIVTLVNQEQNPGNYEVEFSGSGLPSGIYFYKLSATPVGGQAGDFHQTKKMILLK